MLTRFLKAVNCESFNKYFLNELECDSECCDGHLCSAHLETHETAASDIEEDDFVSSCCVLHHKH